MLRANGVRAWISEGGASGGGAVPIHVPPEAHEAAVSTLARHMEVIHALAGQSRSGERAERRPAQGRPPREVTGDEPEAGPPLVMERFRQAGLLIALVLAPLLVVSLTRVPMSRGVALGIVVLGMIAIAAARSRGE
ncbi:MAG: hypothetical protein GEU81_09815 [Nitriliruptorales bacterium]|nr:hypothetical protein [Nitriliruptorales bacterium]